MAVGVLLVVGDVVPGLHLVRGGEVLGLGLAAKAPEVEDVGRPVLPRWLVTALSSSWLDPSGVALLISMSYFSLNVSSISP